MECSSECLPSPTFEGKLQELPENCSPDSVRLCSSDFRQSSGLFLEYFKTQFRCSSRLTERNNTTSSQGS
jgi:hypothetical protein